MDYIREEESSLGNLKPALFSHRDTISVQDIKQTW
jgi:hypothetical protein